VVKNSKFKSSKKRHEGAKARKKGKIGEGGKIEEIGKHQLRIKN